MGNASSTKQKIHNIIATNAEAEASATAKSICVQDVTINSTRMKNCTITGTQTCTSMANASMDVIIAALAKAEVTQETKQAVKGLATGANVNISDQDLKNEVINTLKSKCSALAETGAVQRFSLDLGDVDCSDMSEPLLLDATQYGDAGADCVVQTLVDTALDASADSTNDQFIDGIDPLAFLKSDNMFMMIGVIAGLGIVASMMGKGSDSNTPAKGKRSVKIPPAIKKKIGRFGFE